MMLLEKVRNLKDAFKNEDQSAYDEILGWERSVLKFKRIKELADNDAVKEIIEDFQSVVKGCDKVLLYEKDLSPEKRLVIFERRENYKYFINLFNSAENNLKVLEKQVDDNLYDNI